MELVKQNLPRGPVEKVSLAEGGGMLRTLIHSEFLTHHRYNDVASILVWVTSGFRRVWNWSPGVGCSYRGSLDEPAGRALRRRQAERRDSWAGHTDGGHQAGDSCCFREESRLQSKNRCQWKSWGLERGRKDWSSGQQARDSASAREVPLHVRHQHAPSRPCGLPAAVSPLADAGSTTAGFRVCNGGGGVGEEEEGRCPQSTQQNSLGLSGAPLRGSPSNSPGLVLSLPMHVIFMSLSVEWNITAPVLHFSLKPTWG